MYLYGRGGIEPQLPPLCIGLASTAQLRSISKHCVGNQYRFRLGNYGDFYSLDQN